MSRLWQWFWYERRHAKAVNRMYREAFGEETAPSGLTQPVSCMEVIMTDQPTQPVDARALSKAIDDALLTTVNDAVEFREKNKVSQETYEFLMNGLIEKRSKKLLALIEQRAKNAHYSLPKNPTPPCKEHSSCYQQGMHDGFEDCLNLIKGVEQ